MKNFGKLGIAGILIATIAASSAITPAYAGKKERRTAAGIAIGAIAGAIIVNEIGKKRDRRYKRRHRDRDRAFHRSNRRWDAPRHRYRKHRRHHRPAYRYDYEQPRVVYREPQPRLRYEGRVSAGEVHTNWCYNRYRSYRAYDNTFQPYHGRRKQCFSPYN